MSGSKMSDNLGCLIKGHVIMFAIWDGKGAESGYIGTCFNCLAKVERDFGDPGNWRLIEDSNGK